VVHDGNGAATPSTLAEFDIMPLAIGLGNKPAARGHTKNRPFSSTPGTCRSPQSSWLAVRVKIPYFLGTHLSTPGYGGLPVQRSGLQDPQCPDRKSKRVENVRAELLQLFEGGIIRRVLRYVGLLKDINDIYKSFT
jgi:hypothetical protein